MQRARSDCFDCRIVRPSLVSLVVLPAATLAAVVAVASVVDLAALPVGVAVSSMCRTFVVPNPPLVMLRLVVSQDRIDRIPLASVQRGLARLEGSVPPSG